MKSDRLLSAFLLAAALMLFSPARSLAQAEAGATDNASAGKQVTVTGCLTASEGRYTLGTSTDDLYVLKGDDAQFKKMNAKWVKATGTVTPGANRKSSSDALLHQLQTLTVTRLSKVADTCRAD